MQWNPPAIPNGLSRGLLVPWSRKASPIWHTAIADQSRNAHQWAPFRGTATTTSMGDQLEQNTEQLCIEPAGEPYR